MAQPFGVESIKTHPSSLRRQVKDKISALTSGDPRHMCALKMRSGELLTGGRFADVTHSLLLLQSLFFLGSALSLGIEVNHNFLKDY